MDERERASRCDQRYTEAEVTIIPRRPIPGFDELEGTSLLYCDINGHWRYRMRDRNNVVAATRARRILDIAATVPGAYVDPADVRKLQGLPE